MEEKPVFTFRLNFIEALVVVVLALILMWLVVR